MLNIHKKTSIKFPVILTVKQLTKQKKHDRINEPKGKSTKSEGECAPPIPKGMKKINKKVLTTAK